MAKRPVTLIIMDGYGLNPNSVGNAISLASKPNLDRYFAEYPNVPIMASGLDVGLPDGQMGNSEVGHTNIGAGRVVYQELTRISKSIVDGDFFQKQEFLDAIDNCKTNNSALHLLGLLSDGGVHSHNTHLYALLELAKSKGLTDVFVHCFFDGRDVPPNSAKGFLEELIAKTEEIGCGKVATIMGRYYAMDRDNRWERVTKAYEAMVMGVGNVTTDPVAEVAASYARSVFDEFIIPTIVNDSVKGKPVATINENDSIIFFNFRPDRAREITRTFVDSDFKMFERGKGFFKTCYVCMTQYDKTFENVLIAFKPESLTNTMGEYISNKGLKQLRIAETEKYAHVTFFFNGGVEQPYPGEDRVLIPSPKVATYDLQPEMSATAVADAVVERINSGEYDMIVLNYANCDMVGHTGIIDATIKAVETVDKCVGRTVDATLAQGGVALITADHGNADMMIDPETGGPFTAHTTEPVPFIVIGAGDVKLQGGNLSCIAPTMLKIMELPVPVEMTGHSLIV
jgi:2,3-bisphosphoglycerate-independent phosphoglycerate mutase